MKPNGTGIRDAGVNAIGVLSRAGRVRSARVIEQVRAWFAEHGPASLPTYRAAHPGLTDQGAAQRVLAAIRASKLVECEDQRGVYRAV